MLCGFVRGRQYGWVVGGGVANDLDKTNESSIFTTVPMVIGVVLPDG